MPEVREVFRLATEEFRPDPGFVDRQEGHRHKRERRRKIGAFAVVAAIGVVVAVLVVQSASEQRQSQPLAPTPGTNDPIEHPGIRRHVKIEDGVPFSFTVRTRGWERFGNISINKSTEGPQAAEGIIYWSTFPGGDYADYYGHEARPCTRLLSPPVGSSVSDLTAAVSTAPGIRLLSGPSDLAVGGYPAQHVELAVREDVGCDPGFFYAWRDVYGGALWTTTPVGTSLNLWIVDVDGTRFFISAATLPEATPTLGRDNPADRRIDPFRLVQRTQAVVARVAGLGSIPAGCRSFPVSGQVSDQRGEHLARVGRTGDTSVEVLPRPRQRHVQYPTCDLNSVGWIAYRDRCLDRVRPCWHYRIPLQELVELDV